MNEDQIRKIIRSELQSLVGTSQYTFQKPIQMLDGRNIQTGRTTGTKIATDTDQKVGFFGTTPVVQPTTVAEATGGSTIDSEARDAVNDVISRLQDLGLIA